MTIGNHPKGRMAMNRLPQSSREIGSFAECRAAYDECRTRLLECKRMMSATNESLSYRTREVRGAKREAAHLRRDMIQITKKQHANEKLKSCGAWSGAAIGCVTLLWAGFAEYGYPGPAWLFEHEFVYGAVCWFTTILFAWAARAFHSVS